MCSARTDVIKPRFGWTWIDGEDDEKGNSWIQIGPLNANGDCSEEMATIMCRNFAQVQEKHPGWIEYKEADAQFIVDALNELTK